METFEWQSTAPGGPLTPSVSLRQLEKHPLRKKQVCWSLKSAHTGNLLPCINVYSSVLSSWHLLQSMCVCAHVLCISTCIHTCSITSPQTTAVSFFVSIGQLRADLPIRLQALMLGEENCAGTIVTAAAGGDIVVMKKYLADHPNEVSVTS